MPTSRYPKATWLGNGLSGGSYTGGPWKGVIHTTETAGLPSYNSGRYAPHLTYDPKRRLWYQHTDLLTAARALRNQDGGVQTNRDRAIQIEIICYSAWWIAEDHPDRLWVAELSPEALADIREFMLWTEQEFGIPFQYPETHLRFGLSEWDNYAGWCGHKHVPENYHWDPGALDIDALMTLGEEEDMSELVTKLQEALVEAGYDIGESGVDGDLGPDTFAALVQMMKHAKRGGAARRLLVKVRDVLS